MSIGTVKFFLFQGSLQSLPLLARADIRDVSLVAKHFGETVPSAPANCDLTGPTAGVPDGKIDIRDVSLVAKHFGDHYP